MIGYLPQNLWITCDCNLYDLGTAKNIPYSKNTEFVCEFVDPFSKWSIELNDDKWSQIYESFSEFEIYS